MTEFHTMTAADGRVKTVATFALPEDQTDTKAGDGTFSAIVSTFNTRVEGMMFDQMLKPGCFTRSLAENGFPACVWSHEWDTPPIGATLAAEETGEGLYVEGRLFIESSPLAAQVYTAMTEKNGDGRPVLREFSIGFEIAEADWEIHDEDEVLAISDTNLVEFGPCLKGRNVSRLIEVNGAAAPADPTLARFPRRQESPEVRALKLALPRHF